MTGHWTCSVFAEFQHCISIGVALWPRNQALHGYFSPSGSAVPRRHDPWSSPWP